MAAVADARGEVGTMLSAVPTTRTHLPRSRLPSHEHLADSFRTLTLAQRVRGCGV